MAAMSSKEKSRFLSHLSEEDRAVAIQAGLSRVFFFLFGWLIRP